MQKPLRVFVWRGPVFGLLAVLDVRVRPMLGEHAHDARASGGRLGARKARSG